MQNRSLDFANKRKILLTDLLVTGMSYYKVHPSSNKTNCRLSVLNPINTFIDRNPDLAEQVRQTLSPRDASDFANLNSNHDDPAWKDKQLAVMEELVRNKIEQHPYVKQILLESGDKDIIEMNDDDAFWGWGQDHKGENNLGKIWMKLRSEIIAK